MRLGFRSLRCLVVWSTATMTLAVPARWLVDRAAAGVEAFEGGEARGPVDEQALVGAAAVALLGCLAWAWLAASAVVVETLTWRTTPAVTSRVPAPLRRVVLSACGVAIVGSALQPAYAEPGAHHGRPPPIAARVVGLPLPELVPTVLRHPSRAQEHPWVVVAPGDSLWSIAERDLPPGSPNAAVAACWKAIYAANRAVVGPDPDLITAGTQLRMPRKESS